LQQQGRHVPKPGQQLQQQGRGRGLGEISGAAKQQLMTGKSLNKSGSVAGVGPPKGPLQAMFRKQTAAATARVGGGGGPAEAGLARAGGRGGAGGVGVSGQAGKVGGSSSGAAGKGGLGQGGIGGVGRGGRAGEMQLGAAGAGLGGGRGGASAAAGTGPGRATAVTAGVRPPVGRGVGGCAPCSCCKKVPMSQPYKAPCGHLGCYSCWVKLLSSQLRGAACPVCKAGIRHVAQLTQAAFA
jgi:hypothetical protein